MKDMATKDFAWSEVECKCGCGGRPKMELMEELQKLRSMLDRPVTVTSGFRCPKHNKEEGGAKSSAHMTGFAVDIACKSDYDRFKVIGCALCLFQGIGISANFIHLDLRDRHVIWTY